MHVGVVFPQTEIGADPAGVKAYAQAVQQMGFEHLVAYDHVLGADASVRPGWSGAYSSESLFHEPMVLFGYLAAIAPNLELVPAVIILPQRQTVLAAKQAAEIDVLTNGKLRFGIGIGWNAVEYEGLGMSFSNRGRRFEEQIELMRRLWTEPVLSFEGKYHKISAAGLNPLPVQRPIPIWIGASAEVAIKRAAEIADGYLTQRPLEGGWEPTLEKVRRWREAVGKDPSTFGIDARINLASGATDDWRKQFETWRGLGATHVTLNTMNAGLRGADAHVDRLAQAVRVLKS
jgi:probable F420-dependent oxidoreductase